MISDSRVWVTLSHGICNEIYCPRIDQACVHIADLPTPALAASS